MRILVDEGPARVHELIALGRRVRPRDHRLARPRPRGRPLPGPRRPRRRRRHRRRGRARARRRHLPLGQRRPRGLVRPRPRRRGRPLRRRDRAAARRARRGPPPVNIRAEHVVLATGGAGQLYSVTTNPTESTGDGVAMALRAGVPTADVEFVQFHPTALHHPAMPRPLLSEALRGHGALLRDRDGERFVDELAPRDVVSRAMAARMAEQGVDHLWLDATGLERFSQRFPTIAASLASIGLDPEKDWLPIAPAAHHLSGGVRHRPVGRHRAAGPVGGGRGRLHRRARRQPAGLQLAARGHGLRRPPGRADRRRRRRGPEASGALRGRPRRRPLDGIGSTRAARPRPVRPPRDGRRRDRRPRRARRRPSCATRSSAP